MQSQAYGCTVREFCLIRGSAKDYPTQDTLLHKAGNSRKLLYNTQTLKEEVIRDHWVLSLGGIQYTQHLVSAKLDPWNQIVVKDLVSLISRCARRDATEMTMVRTNMYKIEIYTIQRVYGEEESDIEARASLGNISRRKYGSWPAQHSRHVIQRLWYKILLFKTKAHLWASLISMYLKLASFTYC